MSQALPLPADARARMNMLQKNAQPAEKQRPAEVWIAAATSTTSELPRKVVPPRLYDNAVPAAKSLPL